MNELMQQLHDIEGIDPVSPWPLAAGWWTALALIILSILVLAGYCYRRRVFLRSWKNDALGQLATLEDSLSEANLKITAIALSEFLRRIVVHRFPRKDCAGLAGLAWLEWLKKRDPRRFDWVSKGRVLIEAPYAESKATLSQEQLKELIRAARGWIR